jgi:hypothetical protein
VEYSPKDAGFLSNRYIGAELMFDSSPEKEAVSSRATVSKTRGWVRQAEGRPTAPGVR